VGQSFIVEPSLAGVRLDHALSDWLGVTRGAARRLIEQDAVRVAGRPPRKGVRLAAGEVVHLLGEVDPPPMPDTSLDLTELDRGDGWVVVDKPAGAAVHPLSRTETGTIGNVLMARYPQMAGVGEGGLRSGVVHRLDLSTTGCLIFATEQRAWQRLRDAFVQHRTRKIYHALVEGDPTPRQSTLQLRITRHRPAQVRVVDRGGTPCHLAWRPLKRFDDRTLVEVDLGTGFLHQVRVMLAHHGHPVVGDGVYGATRAGPRPLLHAAELSVEDAQARAPTPADLRAACA
jgi:23S rRNA pseudouridine1911/1915/1917 synthase